MESPVDRLKRLVLSWDFWELDKRIVQQDLGVQDDLRALPSSFSDIQVHTAVHNCEVIACMKTLAVIENQQE